MMGIQEKKQTITRFVKDTPHSISDTNDVMVRMVSAEWRCSLLLLLAWARLSDGFCPIACDCNEEALSGDN